MLGYWGIALRGFSGVLASEFVAVFGVRCLRARVGLRAALWRFGSGVCVLRNYQIYFDWLLCFWGISVTGSRGRGFASDSAVWPGCLAWLQHAY